MRPRSERRVIAIGSRSESVAGTASYVCLQTLLVAASLRVLVSPLVGSHHRRCQGTRPDCSNETVHTQRREVEDALRVFTESLGPWLGDRVGVWPPDQRGNARPHDPGYLIEVALGHVPRLPELESLDVRAALHRIREARNRWAHFDELPHEQVADLLNDVTTCLRCVGGQDISPSSFGHDHASGASGSGHRRSRSAEFRAEQWGRRYAPHCRPINELVDAFIVEAGGRWMPFLAPYHGGTDAEVLLLFQDPGRMTNPIHGGSGFIGCENDDPSAETLAICLDRAGVSPSRVMPWNAYPWYLEAQGAVTSSRLNEGLDALRRLVGLLPKCHTVVTGGAVAHRSWARFRTRHPSTVQPLRHLETFHTSGQGIVNGGQQTKDIGMAHVVATLKAAVTRP